MVHFLNLLPLNIPKKNSFGQMPSKSEKIELIKKMRNKS